MLKTIITALALVAAVPAYADQRCVPSGHYGWPQIKAWCDNFKPRPEEGDPERPACCDYIAQAQAAEARAKAEKAKEKIGWICEIHDVNGKSYEKFVRGPGGVKNKRDAICE